MATAFHLMWCSVLLPGASGGLFVVLADVHDLPLGALSDQVSAHAGNIFKTVTWGRRGGRNRGTETSLKRSRYRSSSANTTDSN